MNESVSPRGVSEVTPMQSRYKPMGRDLAWGTNHDNATLT